MEETSEKPRRYNLAWHRADVANAASYLSYTLIPVWLGHLAGSMEFERISYSGLPLPKVNAKASDLASPRLQDDTEGIGHPNEAKLIRVLQLRATRASNILPEIIPSVTFRAWSRMELTEGQRLLLHRAGGI